MEDTRFWSPAHAMPGVARATGYAVRSPAVSVHRGLPSPYLTLVHAIDGPVRTAWRREDVATPAATVRDALVGGLHTSPAYIHQPLVQVGVQLAVHPLAARRLLGVSASELMGTDVGLDDLGDGSVVRATTEQLAEAVWERRFTIVTEDLHRRIDRHEHLTGPRPEVVEAWRWLERRSGRGSMTDLASHVHLSGRQLRAEFVREVGFGPKVVARLMRFDRARHLVTACGGAGLADVAVLCGYADQSHLVREFREFAGVSPSGWFAEERRNVQADDGAEAPPWSA